LKKYPIEENLRKTEIVGLVIGIEIMQRNNYGTAHHASPDGYRERQMNYIGGNFVCEFWQPP
jgi:hypothetical protein